MSKNELRAILNRYISEYKATMFGLSVGTFCYLSSEIPYVIDFEEWGLTLSELMNLLKDLETDGFLKIIDTNNMNWFIEIR